MIWTCPVCHAALRADAQGAHCAEGHRYDRAREGYLNLLLANQKRRANPGDSRAMLDARRQFLGRGWYRPLAEELAAQLATCAPGVLLDLGCGEGYYLAHLASQMPQWHWAGLDIAKDGVRLAARRTALSQAELAVASSKRLPLADGTVAAVLSVFAPADSAEVHRVLQPGGYWLQALPGPEHLLALKAELYDQVRLHTAPPVPEGFRLADEVAVHYPMVITEPDDLAALLAMTPFAYRIKDEVRARLLARQSFTLDADFLVRRWVRA